MIDRSRIGHRLQRRNSPSLRNWQTPEGPAAEGLASDAVVDCGWGQLIFAHTFADHRRLAQLLRDEPPGRRNVALYLRDPHVVLSLAPHELFLDPSHTYRLWLGRYRFRSDRPQGYVIRKLHSDDDIEAVNDIYAMRHMVPIDPAFVRERRKSRVLTYLVAQDSAGGRIIGTVTGVDHRLAFDDPENGASLWCLAVDPQTPHPGVGEELVRRLAEHYLARGRDFVDLSVLHDNAQAIALYEKLGFERVPVFCLKRKNTINEPLFIAPPPEAALNPYARIIVDEARRRGIAVEVVDEEGGYFTLTFGGRSVTCRESLTELTSAIAMSRCQDKAVTLRLLKKAGLNVPDQQIAGSAQQNQAFLEKHRRLVVKPANGEQGMGINVDVRTAEDLERAVEQASRFGNPVLLEQLCDGQDLRIVVIGYKVAAAAVRRPAQVTGTGRHSVAQLIDRQSRRRQAATGGESHIPLDDETERCVQAAGLAMDSVLPAGQVLMVRRTANLHTGGTIHDVTDILHRQLVEAAVKAARVLDIPVVGLDFLVPAPDGPDYAVIEANERPGLANHEPQPTAQRFIDLLFPHTAVSLQPD
ncbi:MAG: N-acetylglutaminylglutamine synthetase [Pseudomonadota bacterium]|nr:N-acetylglutaminylglutamine synthetase [Pseudomonadota bacterium]